MAFRTGYGVGLFGADLHGIDSKLVEGAVSASISTTASASGGLIFLTSASVSIGSTASAAGFTALAGASTATLTSSTALYWNRVRLFEAQDNLQSSVSAGARYKWLDAPDAATTWATADYLERAA